MDDVYLKWARQARAGLREVRRILILPTPENLDFCRLSLTESVARLKELEVAIRSARPPQAAILRAELRGLRKDLAQVNAMIQQAASFHQGWAKLLASITDGYTPQGEPAQREPIRRLSIEG